MEEIFIPEEEQKIIDSINMKINNKELRPEQYKHIAEMYEKHILGFVSLIRNPRKKYDFESFYGELTGIYKFNEEEMGYLLNEEGKSETSLFLVQKILEKDEEGKKYLDKIDKKERTVNEAWRLF